MTLTKYRFPVGTEVRRTLGFWAQSLAKLANLPVSVGEIFQPDDYDPVFTASGALTYTVTQLSSARFIQIGNLVWVQVSCNGTTGGVASNTIMVTLPVKARQPDAINRFSALSGWVSDGGNALGAVVYIGSQGGINITRYDAANFGLGVGRNLSISGWYETD